MKNSEIHCVLKEPRESITMPPYLYTGYFAMNIQDSICL